MVLYSKQFCLFFFLAYSFTLDARRWPYTIVSHNHIFQSATRVKHHILTQSSLKSRYHTMYLSSLFSAYGDTMLQWNAFVTSTSAALGQALEKVHTSLSIQVRVLLSRVDIHGTATWNFHAQQGFIVHYDDGTVIKKIKLSHVAVVAKDAALLLNGKQIKKNIYVKPVDGYADCNGTVYDGDFMLVQTDKEFLCINSVDLEDYVASVLCTESWPGWPLEVNKVFAIASRSYVVCKLLEARKSKRPYHVKNTNADQTYSGRHDSHLLRQAVDQTRGVVLGFDGVPILAMFDCCCGGIIPAYIDDLNVSRTPYLARKYACHYCKKCSLYSWQITYDQHTFEQLIHGYTQKVQHITDVRVTKKDKAGLVHQVTIKDRNEQTSISGKQVYSLLKEVKSFYFTINKKGTKIIFNGHGFGHHRGLCQWGAREMVRQGFDYKSILQFYYPSTNFMKLHQMCT